GGGWRDGGGGGGWVGGALLGRDGGGRSVCSSVRRGVDWSAGLPGGGGASRPDRPRHCRDLAPYCQAYDRNHSLANLRAASSPGWRILRYDCAGWRRDADGWTPCR